jgi:hypothetical protein
MSLLYQQSHRVASRNFRGEAAIITPEDRRINILNPVATEIWELCRDRPKSIEDLCVAMSGRYTAEPEVIRADIIQFVETLIELGALVSVEQ